jgi:hypothetical protein
MRKPELAGHHGGEYETLQIGEPEVLVTGIAHEHGDDLGKRMRIPRLSGVS